MYDIFYVSKGDIIEAEWEKIKSRYPTAQAISNVDSYNKIKSRAFTKMFWVIWEDVILVDEFDLTDYHATKWDDMYVHVFLNDQYYDGVCLFPKDLNISKKEFDHRFFINKKNIEIKASMPKPYDKFFISTYDEYLNAVNISKTEMFWVVWDDLIIDKNFMFRYRIPFYDSFHKNITHVFKNENYFDGICLFSKNTIISKKEFDHRFFINKKEVDIKSSTTKPYDIFFISYNEPNADENYQKMKQKFPKIKRIHGIKGIHNAHKKAAKMSKTEMFWVVDGDAHLLETFNFDFKIPAYEKDLVCVFRSQNPVNELEYGYGGVKLLPKKLTMLMDLTSTDMTTSISNKFKAIDQVSNVSAFNTDPFNTWKSAFRECVKLSSRIIQGQNNQETEERLAIWCTVGDDKPFGKFAIAGAKFGRDYGEANRDNEEALKKINDFDWLEQEFKKYYG